MDIKELHIKNFKSLVDVAIIQPNPFTVFVGPNGSGKSNIFEAIEFGNFCYRFSTQEAVNLFGRLNILNKHLWGFVKEKAAATYEAMQQNMLLDDGPQPNQIAIDINTEKNNLLSLTVGFDAIIYGTVPGNIDTLKETASYKKFIANFSRLFIGNQKLRRLNTFDDNKLNIDASNLENVLERLLKNKMAANELEEYLALLIPGFEKVAIITTPLSNTKELLMYEKMYNEPFGKNLISDGTYNILALLTAILQNDEPQFLCIEEPENGLHPYAIKELVNFFRQQCTDKGHHIWLNTHSQTLVNELQPHEIILVDKNEGATQIKQFRKDKNLHGLKMDFAWLSNTLGGGVPW